MATLKFSGYLASTAVFPSVGSTQFHADAGADTTHAPLVSSQGFIPPSCTVTELRVDPTANTSGSTTYTIYKNGVATAVTVTVGASSITPQTDAAHTVTFNGTSDVLDLVSVRSGSLATSTFFSATVKTTPL